MLGDQLERIAPESVNALNDRYVFLKNAIPGLELEYQKLQDKIIKANGDFAEASSQKADILNDKEGELDIRERQLEQRKQGLDEQEVKLNELKTQLDSVSKYQEASKVNIQNMINESVAKKSELDDMDKSIQTLLASLDTEREEIAKLRHSFDLEKLVIIEDFNKKQESLSKSQAILDEKILKYNAAMDSVSRASVDIENSRPKADQKLAEAHAKLNEYEAKMVSLVKREDEIKKAEEALKQKQDFINSKELELKGIKAQQDKRESKIRELIANNGVNVADIQL